MGSLDQATLPKHMLIDGKLVGAEATYPSANPATGEVLGYAPDASAADANAAVAAARRAFDEPRGRPMSRSAPAALSSCTPRWTRTGRSCAS